MHFHNEHIVVDLTYRIIKNTNTYGYFTITHTFWAFHFNSLDPNQKDPTLVQLLLFIDWRCMPISLWDGQKRDEHSPFQIFYHLLLLPPMIFVLLLLLSN